MKLLLASVAANMMDKFMKYIPLNYKIVGFIATASDNDSNKSYMQKDKDKLIELGFKIIDIDLKTTNSNLLENLNKVDIIFVAGGNSFYLLEKSIESGFDKILTKLFKTDMIYIGSSAGAVIIGPTIAPFTKLDDPNQAKNLKSYNGINLTNKLLFVHSDDFSCAQIYNSIYKKYSLNYDVIKLTNDKGLVIEDNVVTRINS